MIKLPKKGILTIGIVILLITFFWGRAVAHSTLDLFQGLKSALFFGLITALYFYGAYFIVHFGLRLITDYIHRLSLKIGMPARVVMNRKVELIDERNKDWKKLFKLEAILQILIFLFIIVMVLWSGIFIIISMVYSKHLWLFEHVDVVNKL